MRLIAKRIRFAGRVDEKQSLVCIGSPFLLKSCERRRFDEHSITRRLGLSRWPLEA